ncbi:MULTISPECIES: N-formylglutamate amidohydrolase [unclassified Roseovarius]|uniref:N-formylglutamate amidohydrolase n=1 Tax=unclassified Roseovarius TaxID=2614913 RepID=UPI00273E32FD|nr:MULTISPECIES: N-formylglutamate amidohydrolase [unclassified Roseovarius]
MFSNAAVTLIGPADPAPVEVVPGDSTSDLVLLCEHAGRAIPAALGELGVSDAVLNSHRGWDIGAEDVARGVARALRAPLVLQRYSRLVIDCNRPTGCVQSVPEISDHEHIPANKSISESERRARITEIFDPMNKQLDTLFAAHEPRAVFSIHSFTPRMDDHDRPWHAGFLTRRSPETGEALMATIAGMRPDLHLALNQPYQIDDETDWFIPQYAEPLGLPHSLIEIRNDQIDHAEGVSLWVELLSRAIGAFMEELP